MAPLAAHGVRKVCISVGGGTVYLTHSALISEILTDKKFRPEFLHHLAQHHQPTVRTVWGLVLNQLDVLNPAVVSVRPLPL